MVPFLYIARDMRLHTFFCLAIADGHKIALHKYNNVIMVFLGLVYHPAAAGHHEEGSPCPPHLHHLWPYLLLWHQSRGGTIQ